MISDFSVHNYTSYENKQFFLYIIIYKTNCSKILMNGRVLWTEPPRRIISLRSLDSAQDPYLRQVP